MNPFLLVLIILGAAVASVAFWVGIVALIGLMGWRQLAAAYPTDRWPEAEDAIAFSMQSGYIGVSRYNNVLSAVLTEEGLYLRPMKIFSFNHPPIFIPWVAMGEPERGFLVGLKVPLASGHTIAFRGELARRIEAALAAAHAGPPPVADGVRLDDEGGLEDWTGEQTASGASRLGTGAG